jgi:nitrile hydratase accessory protein
VPEPAAPLDASGPAAPPRQNGELVFAAPWESRLFGLTMALHQAGVFEWEEFRARLIAAIAQWEAERGPWRYYERWQLALERVLAAKRLCSDADVAARVRALAARPAGHDHGD